MSSSLASQFLLQEREAGPLRDLLFRAASDPDLSANSVSETLALGYVRKSIAHATAISASPATSATVLAKFAKDTRVSVRKALLSNPSLGKEQLLALTKWACERDPASDRAEMVSQVHRLDAQQLAELSRYIAEKRLLPLHPSVSSLRIIASALMSDDEAFAAADLKSFRTLGDQMAILALNGSAGGRSLDDVADRVCSNPDTGKRDRAELMQKLLSSGGILTHELIDLWEASGGLRPGVRDLCPAALVEAGVLERLSMGGPAHIALAIVNRAPESRVGERIADASLDELEVLVAAVGWEYFSAKSEQRLADRLLKLALQRDVSEQRSRIGAIASALIMQARHELPHFLLVGTLRLGGLAATAMWLSQRSLRMMLPDGSYSERVCGQSVNASALMELVLVPGFALDRSVSNYMLRNRPEGWAGLTDELLEAAPASAEHGAAVVAALGDYLSGFILRRGAKALYPYIRSRIGPDELRWQTFLSMADEWQGSIDGLIDTAELLTGR